MPDEVGAGPAGIRPGIRIDRYEILNAIGAGGMGEVWRARDTTLHRDVAIKALPPELAGDSDRLKRLQREAQLLAALNHPNIAVIHGFETWGATSVLVLEFVDGVTLAHHLARGRLPIDETLGLALQIAESLEAAHDKGIVHRDLKPANIKLTSEGRIKVLDFGIAKAVEREPGQGSQHTTITMETGVTGTPAYMAPEQARGEPATSQVDIWSFGVVLYEMLTGVAPFRATTTVDVLAKVLGGEVDYDTLPPGTSPRVVRLLRRRLEKTRRQRFQHIGDVRLEIEDIRAVSDDARAVTRRASAFSRALPWVAGLAIVAAAATVAWSLRGRRAAVPAPPMAFSIPIDDPLGVPVVARRSVAISDDGMQIAYTSRSRLWLRRINEHAAVAVPGTPGAANPFFSPDGTWVGFYGDHPGLMRVPVTGGTPEVIVRFTARSTGAAWGPDGTIVYGTTEGLYRVPATGGTAALIAKPDPQKNEQVYAWPYFLPDGQVLYTIVSSAAADEPRIALLNPTTGESRPISGGAAPVYLRSGQLVYAAGRTLKAASFDPSSAQISSEPSTIANVEVRAAGNLGAAEFALSQHGTLVYLEPDVAATQTLRTLHWIDRQGREEPVPIKPAQFVYPRISPDGAMVVLDRVTASGRDLWLLNLARLSLTQLTDGPTEDLYPLWSRDGRRVFFASDRTGQFDVYSQAADGASGARLELSAPGSQMPQSFTPDGTTLIVSDNFADMMQFRVGAADRLEPVLGTGFEERLASVSPDGQWLVYESNESGDRFEIFVRPYGDPSRRREQVSLDGGRYPRWSRTSAGLEIVYTTLEGMMTAVPVSLSPNLSLGRPVTLFEWQRPPAGRTGLPYDISPTDGRFLVARNVADRESAIML